VLLALVHARQRGLALTDTLLQPLAKHECEPFYEQLLTSQFAKLIDQLNR
jgi:hypothetical protein